LYKDKRSYLKEMGLNLVLNDVVIQTDTSGYEVAYEDITTTSTITITTTSTMYYDFAPTLHRRALVAATSTSTSTSTATLAPVAPVAPVTVHAHGLPGSQLAAAIIIPLLVLFIAIGWAVVWYFDRMRVLQQQQKQQQMDGEKATDVACTPTARVFHHVTSPSPAPASAATSFPPASLAAVGAFTSMASLESLLAGVPLRLPSSAEIGARKTQLN
jgi:hypothetical protein